MNKRLSKGQKHGQAWRQKLRGFEEDHLWVRTNLDLLLSQYPEQWIAVKAGQVTASDPDLMSLLEKLKDPQHTCIEFLTREPLEMIL